MLVKYENAVPLRTACFIIIGLISCCNCQPTCSTWGEAVNCVSGSQPHQLRRGLVSDSQTTKSITLRNCLLATVEYEAFKALPIVNYIDISSNRIDDLKLGVLDELNTLTFLNISYNRLGSLRPGLFDQMPNLELLDARGNQLRFIETRVLKPLTKLLNVDISDNILTSLPKTLLENQVKLRFLDVSRNNITDLPIDLFRSNPDLDFLNFDRCNLDSVPNFARLGILNSLRHLLLSTNNIESLADADVFGNLVNLKILDMTSTKINFIQKFVFKPLRKIEEIQLRYNRLSRLPAALFNNLPNLTKLNISNNMIEFLPETIFNGSPNIKFLSIANNRLTYLPGSFNSILPSLRSVEISDNAWQCNCLMDILIELKVSEVYYGELDGSKPVCVVTRSKKCERDVKSTSFYDIIYKANMA